MNGRTLGSYEEEIEAIKKETNWSLLLEDIIDELIESDSIGEQALEFTSFKAFRLRELLKEKLKEETK